jgi:hypothetical protein
VFSWSVLALTDRCRTATLLPDLRSTQVWASQHWELPQRGLICVRPLVNAARLAERRGYLPSMDDHYTIEAGGIRVRAEYRVTGFDLGFRCAR